jgi:hypothetical protein
MSIADALITFAAAVRADRAANPAGAGDGTGLELLIAPKFQALVQTLVAEVSAAPLRILTVARQPT